MTGEVYGLQIEFSSCLRVQDDDFGRSRISLILQKIFLVSVSVYLIPVAPIYESYTVSCCIPILERIICISRDLFFLGFHSSLDDGLSLWSIQMIVWICVTQIVVFGSKLICRVVHIVCSRNIKWKWFCWGRFPKIPKLPP